MAMPQGSYAVLQFSPLPERLEFVNIGVVLLVPSTRYMAVKFSESAKRVEKLFGRLDDGYFHLVKTAFAHRIEMEVKTDWSLERLERFGRSRANEMRLSKLLPIAVTEQPEAILNKLFSELVGGSPKVKKQPKIRTELRRKFELAGVEKLLARPKPVKLRAGVIIEAPYAYQNGTYNLIDPMRMGTGADHALREAGKRAIEGRWLYDSTRGTDTPKRLVVVGDFQQQDESLFPAIESVMSEHQVKLYSFDELDPLLEEIRKSSILHSLGS